MSSQVRIQLVSGLWSLERSSLFTSRSSASRTWSGHVGGLDPGAVVVGAVGLVLAELLADRRELLAEQELALVLLDRLPDVLADLLVDVGLGQVVAGPLDQQRQPLLGVGRLEQLALAVHREVRRPAGRVGQRRRVVDRVHRVDDLPGLALLEHGDDELLVLRGELDGPLGHGWLVHVLDLDPQGRTGTGDAAADAGPPTGAQHSRGLAATEPADLLDGRHHAVRRVAVLEPGGDQELVVGAGRSGVNRCLGRLVELDRHDHARQQHDVVEEENRQTLGGHRSPSGEG